MNLAEYTCPCCNYVFKGAFSSMEDFKNSENITELMSKMELKVPEDALTICPNCTQVLTFNGKTFEKISVERQCEIMIESPESWNDIVKAKKMMKMLKEFRNAKS